MCATLLYKSGRQWDNSKNYGKFSLRLEWKYIKHIRNKLDIWTNKWDFKYLSKLAKTKKEENAEINKIIL